MKTQYEDRLKLKDEQIEYYKDFKARPVYQNGWRELRTALYEPV